MTPQQKERMVIAAIAASGGGFTVKKFYKLFCWHPDTSKQYFKKLYDQGLTQRKKARIGYTHYFKYDLTRKGKEWLEDEVRGSTFMVCSHADDHHPPFNTVLPTQRFLDGKAEFACSFCGYRQYVESASVEEQGFWLP